MLKELCSEYWHADNHATDIWLYFVSKMRYILVVNETWTDPTKGIKVYSTLEQGQDRFCGGQSPGISPHVRRNPLSYCKVLVCVTAVN